jgi:hypothetical protein
MGMTIEQSITRYKSNAKYERTHGNLQGQKMGRLIEEIRTTTSMSNEEIVDNLKAMVFGVQAFERFTAKERETLDKAWNIIDQYENCLKADMVAMLEALDLQIDGVAAYNLEVAKVQRLLRDRIDKLKEGKTE